MTKIAVIGDPVLDQIYRTSDELVPGGKMLGHFVGSAAGGTTANFACAVAKFGLDANIIGQIMEGWEGYLHEKAFQSAGVDTRCLRSHTVERGAHTIIAIAPDGEKSLVYIPFPETGDEQTTAQELKDFDLVYVMAADFARIEGAIGKLPSQICVDVDAAAGFGRAKFDQVAQAADLLFINDVGFRKLFGNSPDTDGVEALLNGGLRCVVCSGGAGTSFAAERGEDGKVKSVKLQALRAEVVDTTGAGDCFNAAFVARRTEGASLHECLEFAMAAGAIATETMGARASIPERSTVVTRMNK